MKEKERKDKGGKGTENEPPVHIFGYSTVYMVYRVQVTAVEPSGELNVGLCYNDHTQRLIVSIVEARHLKAASLDNHSPGFCTARLYLQALLQWVGKRVRRTSIYHFRQGGNVFKPCSDGIHYTDVRFMTHDCS